jgi:hypothetical protein
MEIYDGTAPEEPIIMSDEPFYGPDEVQLQAGNLARHFQRHQETDG